MSNEEILNQRWSKTDKTLKSYLKHFNNLGKNTIDDLIDMFDTLDITYQDLNKPISKAEKRKLDRKIEEWKKKGLLTGYFGYLVKSKTKLTYADLLELLIYSIYVSQEEKTKEYSQEVFTIVANDIYSQALNELPPNIKPKKKFSLTWEFIWSLLWIPTYNKSWDDYLKVLTMTYQQEMYKKIISVIQQNQPLTEDKLKDLVKKQTNRILSINDDKYSGVLSDTCRQLGNKVYVEPFKEEDNLQVRFVAEMDERTTEMCKSLNNKIFYVFKENIFDRYVGTNADDVVLRRFRVNGLVAGINLPPITNFFHWCRSTITYLIDYPNVELVTEYGDLRRILGKEMPDTIEEYAKKRYNKDGYFEQVKEKANIKEHYDRYIEVGEIKRDMSFGDYYKKVVTYTNKLKGTKIKDMDEIGKITYHSIDRMLKREISPESVKEILENYTDKIIDNSEKNQSIKLCIGDRVAVLSQNTHNLKSVW